MSIGPTHCISTSVIPLEIPASAEAKLFHTLPEEIARSLGGCSQIIQLPILDIGHRVRDYLDFFKPSEMDESIMRGTDRVGRPFIAFKITSGNSEKSIITLFKRYVDRDNWVACFSHPHPTYKFPVQSHAGFKTSLKPAEFGHFVEELNERRSIEIDPLEIDPENPVIRLYLDE